MGVERRDKGSALFHIKIANNLCLAAWFNLYIHTAERYA